MKQLFWINEGILLVAILTMFCAKTRRVQNAGGYALAFFCSAQIGILMAMAIDDFTK